MNERPPAWLPRLRAAVSRRPKTFALLAGLLVACSASVPAAVSPSPLQTLLSSITPSPSPSPTPRPLVKARSVAQVGSTVVATGDFIGNGATQIATIDDPKGDLAMRITVRTSFSGDASGWMITGPEFLSLQRAKIAVADVDQDGKDDLVALYDSGANTSRLFVFRSTGSAFTFAGAWWSGDLTWSRARDIVGGHFAADGHDALLVAYQDDSDRMRLLSFAPTGAKFVAPVTAYDSGIGQFDLARTRTAAGHFTRTGGPDQLVVLAQDEKGGRARAVIFDPTPKGMLQGAVLPTDTDYDVTHASIGAADLAGSGHDELVALYTDAKGGARVHVFDLAPAASYLTPLKGWDGWAALPDGAVCSGPGALVLGDWNRDGFADGAVLAPASPDVAIDLPAFRTHLLRSDGSQFELTPGGGRLRCPTWPLNGLPLGFGDATKRPLYVKTDNNPSARPHYGISKADMVYEWLVEGLTTRLAAIYQSQQPDVIGSVRSVRMTDRHVLPSLDAALVYSGGGPEELMAINYDASVGRRYVDLSPNYGWGYRVPFRVGPYNYFTTYAAVEEALAASPDGDQPAIVAAWRFLPSANGDPTAGGFATSVAASTITIPYRALFGVRYDYDTSTRTYARYDDGVREVDGANDQAIAAKNIVVVQTEVHFTTAFGLDPAGNPKLEEVLTGSGKGVVFRDGLRQDVTWSRSDVVDAFTLTTPSGEIVQLEPGQTWVHVVPSDWSIPSH